MGICASSHAALYVHAASRRTVYEEPYKYAWQLRYKPLNMYSADQGVHARVMISCKSLELLMAVVNLAAGGAAVQAGHQEPFVFVC
jgi:hypothetical protein